jgi:diguanylate cyclase (GGDEF)-like protein
MLIAFPFVAAVCVLIGWGADIELLRRLGTAPVTMNPASAAALLSLSSGLALREYGGKIAGALAWAAIGAGTMIGVLKLIDIALGTHIGIDTLLFAAKLAPGYDRPSRIAPNTAFCFALIGFAFLLMHRRSERAVAAAQAAAIVTALVAVFALVGHLYNVNAFFVVGPLHPVAVPSALSLLSLAALVLIRTSSRGLVAPLSDSGPAGRTSRALLPAAFAIPVAFGWLRQQGEHAGLFTGEVGVALMVMLTMLTMTALVWHNARLLLAADTLRRRAEADVAHMASHDFLTGLPNRGHFMARLIARMRRRPGATRAFAVIIMDLDGFKQVNDRLGHGAGDALLREVGAHLQDCRRHREDLVARLGGDEFVMLLEEIDSAEDAAMVAARIVTGMPSRCGPRGREVPVGISVGIVIAERRHATTEALLADADRALYAAKRGGKGRFAVHAPAEQEAHGLLVT